MENVVRVLSTLALKGAMSRLAGQFQSATATRIDADFAPTVGLLERLRKAEAADVVILTREGLDELIAEGTVSADSKVDLARSYVGIAVKAGAPCPDIATRAALCKALLAARSVAYSRIGASGIYFARLIEQLGIASDVNARAVITAGFTAERLLTDEADLAVQQISELKQVPGVEIVGPIPHELQTPAVFSAGRMAAARQAGAADALLTFLSSPEAAPALRESGLEP
jgi:molybdate transport system substrate-binding protein